MSNNIYFVRVTQPGKPGESLLIVLFDGKVRSIRNWSTGDEPYAYGFVEAFEALGRNPNIHQHEVEDDELYKSIDMLDTDSVNLEKLAEHIWTKNN